MNLTKKAIKRKLANYVSCDLGILQECSLIILALPIKDLINPSKELISEIPKDVTIILYIKCPSSNMSDRNLWTNIDLIKANDEIKFVIGDQKDYNWSKKIIKKYKLTDKCTILFSPVYNKIEPKTMVEWIMKDNLNVRFQTQLHKSIWNHNTKGV